LPERQNTQSHAEAKPPKARPLSVRNIERFCGKITFYLFLPSCELEKALYLCERFQQKSDETKASNHCARGSRSLLKNLSKSLTEMGLSRQLLVIFWWTYFVILMKKELRRKLQSRSKSI
jgi:hypothetical protein